MLQGKLRDQLPNYGVNTYRELFTPRQLLILFTLVKHIRQVHAEMRRDGMAKDRALALATFFAMAFGRFVIAFNKFARWEPSVQRTLGAIGDRQVLKMLYDFSEINCFENTAGCLPFALDREAYCIRELARVGNPSTVTRGNAEKLFYDDETFDAVVTDPPYYSSIYYADLSAFFYVWLKRIVGDLHPAGADGAGEHGDGRARVPGIPTGKVVAGFFSFLGFPRLGDADAVRTAVARGVETGLFAYTTGRPELGEDGRYRLDRSRVAFERAVAEDEIDLDSGFLVAPAALPRPDEFAPMPAPAGGDSDYPTSGGGAGVLGDRENPTATAAAEGSREITLSFSADRNELFNAWNALANLADAAGKVSVRVQAASEAGFDEARIENGVLEPLRELGLIGDDHADRG